MDDKHKTHGIHFLFIFFKIKLICVKSVIYMIYNVVIFGKYSRIVSVYGG